MAIIVNLIALTKNMDKNNHELNHQETEKNLFDLSELANLLEEHGNQIDNEFEIQETSPRPTVNSYQEYDSANSISNSPVMFENHSSFKQAIQSSSSVFKPLAKKSYEQEQREMGSSKNNFANLKQIDSVSRNSKEYKNNRKRSNEVESSNKRFKVEDSYVAVSHSQESNKESPKEVNFSLTNFVSTRSANSSVKSDDEKPSPNMKYSSCEKLEMDRLLTR